ncbi:CDKN2AIP N-terminal-like protein isoform X1 [Loxodonta africana]|uniref:CDKN2AIP N-terminal-like protein isoform X1 n=1 Tax=Loxodonta africana TaxID=9785 RepID=UPI0005404BAB|nr:CDKN2AIP N-terminal-like protein isoform X1 [Loxodonta africana]
MVGGEAAAAVEELVSGVRQAADFAEQFRSYSESEKQWKARMEFILRHLPDYRDPPDGGGRLDQLLSLSMVWANHLFLGCSIKAKVEDLSHFHHQLQAQQRGWDKCDIDPSVSFKTPGITNRKKRGSWNEMVLPTERREAVGMKWNLCGLAF